MKILIIGGMGIIGGAVAEEACLRGEEVWILSRRKLGNEWTQLGAKGIQGDWYNDAFAKEVVRQKFDVIVDTRVFYKSQIKRTMDLIEGFCSQYIYISTDSVYEHPDTDVTECVDINIGALKWDYGKNKREAELYLISNSGKYSFAWTVIRPTITFGDTRIPIGFSCKRNTNTILKRMSEGKPILRFDQGTRHAMCHTSIFGSATYDLLLNPDAYGQFFHIADDNSFTYDDIFAIIDKSVQNSSKFIHLPADVLKRFNLPIYLETIYDKNPEFIVDNSKIKNISPNTKFSVDMDISISKTVEHLMKCGKEDSDYDLLTDAILLYSLDNISDIDEREVVKKYINGLEKTYLQDVVKYGKKLMLNRKLYPIRLIVDKTIHLLYITVKPIKEKFRRNY